MNEYIAYIQEQFDAYLEGNGGAADDGAEDTSAAGTESVAETTAE